MGVTRIYLDKTVLEAARERIRWVFSEFDIVYVSFSGGKDSTVILNLALEVATELNRLPLRVMFIDQEAEWDRVIDYVKSVMYDPRVMPFWLQVPIRLFNATSTDEPWLNCWDPAVQDRWMRQQDPIARTKNVYGTDRFKEMFPAFIRYHHRTQRVASLTGMRCEESPGRTLGNTTKEVYKGETWGAIEDSKRGHYHFCTPAETPIWMGDYSFKRIDQVVAGDEIIGFTKPGDTASRSRRGRRPSARASLVRSRVVATHSQVLPVVKITLESGRTLRCTPEHRWQRKTSRGADAWRFGPARVGDYLGFVVDPATPPLTAEGAWLGGVYDGEGCGDVLVQSAVANPSVCAAIVKAFAAIDVPIQFNDGSEKVAFRILDGRRGLTRFLNRVRSVKRAGPQVDRFILGGRFRTADRVVSITADGVEPVYSLQTEVGTYVAWGFASSNSPIYDWSYTDVWKAIHDHNWRYCTLYDEMYRYGLRVWRMRVSNVHHETAVGTLWYLQEIEPDTWDRLVTRIGGINAAGQLKGEGFYAPSELPAMFTDWVEYRDYLLDNLIVDAEGHKSLKHQFWKLDRDYKTTESFDDLVQAQIHAILLNDTFGTTLDNFKVAHRKAGRENRVS